MEKYLTLIAQEFNIPLKSIKSTVILLDDGNTVPFIARYRKEFTGYLDETQIRNIEKKYQYLTLLKERKETVLESITAQNKLTTELQKKIENCFILSELEDIYLPYKPKKKTRASIAKEKGLEPLANYIMETQDPEIYAKEFISQEVPSEQEALSSAMDIVAEIVAEDFEVRQFLKQFVQQTAQISSKFSDEKIEVPEFDMYKEYQEPIRTIKAHRVLALNRGEKKKILTVKIDWEHSEAIKNIKNYFIIEENIYIHKAIEDSYTRLLKHSILREIRNILTEQAEEQALSVFSKNLEQLLLQRPLKGCVILGIDPGIRTGSKYAVIDAIGNILNYGVVNQHDITTSIQILSKTIKQFSVELIAIGNGTGSKEIEKIVSYMIEQEKLTCQYALVPETGASVYSASEGAKLEFPDIDVSLRGAISIARRLQDPISEYVKIDPWSLGVGQYQHDVNQKSLKTELHNVVVDSVNKVGVNLNTASSELLKYVSGINSLLAKKIALHRQIHGSFKTRNDILDVKGLSQKVFEQSAGFLKIPQGENCLDNTWIHPEKYPLAQAIINYNNGLMHSIKLTKEQLSELNEQFNTSNKEIHSIIQDLEKPNLDPRDSLSQTLLKNKATDIENLMIGSIVQGTVRSIVDFGAFVDIGLKNDALVHISEICNEFIKHPLEKLKLGDILTVMVIDIDQKTQKTKISIKQALEVSTNK